MAALYTAGRVRTLTTTVVQGSWRSGYTMIGGTFSAGEGCDWNNGGGSTVEKGIFIEVDAGAGYLYFHRHRSVTGPTEGQTFYGRTSGASATLQGPAREQAWTTELSAGDLFTIYGQTLARYVQTIVSDDELDTVETGASSAWGQLYAVARDFTPREGLVRLYAGDRGVASLITRSMDRIDARIGRFRAVEAKSTSFTASGDDKLYVATQSSGNITATLRAADEMAPGGRLSFRNGCPGGSGRYLYVNAGAGDSISGGNITIGPGNSAQVVTDGANTWYRAL